MTLEELEKQVGKQAEQIKQLHAELVKQLQLTQQAWTGAGQRCDVFVRRRLEAANLDTLPKLVALIRERMDAIEGLAATQSISGWKDLFARMKRLEFVYEAVQDFSGNFKDWDKRLTTLERGPDRKDARFGALKRKVAVLEKAMEGPGHVEKLDAKQREAREKKKAAQAELRARVFALESQVEQLLEKINGGNSEDKNGNPESRSGDQGDFGDTHEPLSDGADRADG